MLHVFYGIITQVNGIKTLLEIDCGITMIVDTDIYESIYENSKPGDVIKIFYSDESEMWEFKNITHEVRDSRLLKPVQKGTNLYKKYKDKDSE